jgi:hypothetical protein
VGVAGIEPTMWGFTDPVSPKNYSQNKKPELFGSGFTI